MLLVGISVEFTHFSNLYLFGAGAFILSLLTKNLFSFPKVFLLNPSPGLIFLTKPAFEKVPSIIGLISLILITFLLIFDDVGRELELLLKLDFNIYVIILITFPARLYCPVPGDATAKYSTSFKYDVRSIANVFFLELFSYKYFSDLFLWKYDAGPGVAALLLISNASSIMVFLFLHFPSHLLNVFLSSTSTLYCPTPGIFFPKA